MVKIEQKTLWWMSKMWHLKSFVYSFSWDFYIPISIKIFVFLLTTYILLQWFLYTENYFSLYFLLDIFLSCTFDGEQMCIKQEKVDLKFRLHIAKFFQSFIFDKKLIRSERFFFKSRLLLIKNHFPSVWKLVKL